MFSGFHSFMFKPWQHCDKDSVSWYNLVLTGCWWLRQGHSHRVCSRPYHYWVPSVQAENTLHVVIRPFSRTTVPSIHPSIHYNNLFSFYLRLFLLTSDLKLSEEAMKSLISFTHTRNTHNLPQFYSLLSKTTVATVMWYWFNIRGVKFCKVTEYDIILLLLEQ